MALVRPTPILFRKLPIFSAQFPRYQAPLERWSLSETLSGPEGGQVYTKPASIFTSNSFKADLPMSDDNETNNPYQAPTLSDETLAKKDADGPKAKPHPANWWIPWLAYGYVPLVIGLSFISGEPSPIFIN